MASACCGTEPVLKSDDLFESQSDYDSTEFEGDYRETGTSCLKSLNEDLAKLQLQVKTQDYDVTIQVGGRSFEAHKDILAFCSTYFASMFKSGFSEKDKSKISIEGDAQSFDILLQFAYTGVLHLSSTSSAVSLLNMAFYMNFKEVQSFCTQHFMTFMKKHMIRGDTLVNLVLLTQSLGPELKTLAQTSFRYLVVNFMKLCNQPELVTSITKELLETCVNNNNFEKDPTAEEKLLKVVLAWLKDDWEERKQYATNFLRRIRLGLISRKVLKIMLDEQIQEIPECKKMLEVSAGKPPEGAGDISKDKKLVTSFFMLGGENGLPIQYYDYKKGPYRCDWEGLDHMDSLPQGNHLTDSATIVVNGDLYICGGYGYNNQWDKEFYPKNLDYQKELALAEQSFDSDDDEWEITFLSRSDCTYLGSFYRYDAVNNEWKHLPPMRVPRYDLCLAYADGYIYAIGGVGYKYGDESNLNDVECYSIAEQKWTTVCPLPNACEKAKAVTIKDRVVLYELGLVYDAASDAWKKIDIDFDEGHLITLENGECYKVDEGSVNQMICNLDQESPSIKTGPKEKQYGQLLPKMWAGFPFLIKKEMYVFLEGCALKTQYEVKEGQMMPFDSYPWQQLEMMNDNASMAVFTFDKKRLH